MKAEPRLVPVREPTSPLGAVLVLHGGASRQGRPPVSPTQRYAAEFTAARLIGDVDVDVSDPVARVLQGEEWVTA